MSREGTSGLPMVGVVVGLLVFFAGGVRNFLLFLLVLIAGIWIWDSFTESPIPRDKVDVSATVYDMGSNDDTNFTLRVTGNLYNGSDLNLQSVDFIVTVYDCPTAGTNLELCRKLTRQKGQFTPRSDPDTYATSVVNLYLIGVPVPSGVRQYAVSWSNPIGDTNLRIPSN